MPPSSSAKRLRKRPATLRELAAQEPLTPAAEVMGLLAGAAVVTVTYGGDDVGSWAQVGAIVGWNALRFIVAYGAAYGLWYQWPRLAASDKFEPSYSGGKGLLEKEIARSVVSASISIAFDLLARLILAPHAPLRRGFGSLTPVDAAVAVAVVGFIEVHFYCIHRALHEVPWLFRKVHSVHHQSRNPNPFSGLSFHPVEGALYFSPIPLIALAAASFASSATTDGQPHVLWFAVAKAVLDFNPIWGHIGFGGWTGGSMHHYLHHKYGYRLGVNYGGTWLLDGVLGTGMCEEDVLESVGKPSTKHATSRKVKGGA